MSLIPQLMSGRKLEHDLKFASDGPMSGLVHGVQLITGPAATSSAATLTLKFEETSTAGQAQIKADILAIDAAAAADKSLALTVKLPAAITDGPDLAGRMLRIFNSADASAVDANGGGDNKGGEIIILQTSGGSHICTIGKDDYADILFIDQSTPIELKKLKKHTVVLDGPDLDTSNTTAATILPAISSVAYVVHSAKAVMSGATTTMAGSGAMQIKVGSNLAIDLGAVVTSLSTSYETAAASLTPAANNAMTLSASDAVGTEAAAVLTLTVFYYEI